LIKYCSFIIIIIIIIIMFKRRRQGATQIPLQGKRRAKASFTEGDSAPGGSVLHNRAREIQNKRSKSVSFSTSTQLSSMYSAQRRDPSYPSPVSGM
jgi:hypothetical protein